MHRIVQGLEWARRGERPKGLPTGRARGAKAAGLRYERSLSKVLADWEHGSWFEFEDSNGLGWCQPDLLTWWVGLGAVVVVEVKYTWVPEAHSQLELLYRPVVELALGAQMIGVVVCRALAARMPGVAVVSSLQEALGAKRPVLQWLEKTPLQIRSRGSWWSGLAVGPAIL